MSPLWLQGLFNMIKSAPKFFIIIKFSMTKSFKIQKFFHHHIYINSVSLYVCDGGFGGWGKGEAGEATGNFFS
jgi:hypothetical protein